MDKKQRNYIKEIVLIKNEVKSLMEKGDFQVPLDETRIDVNTDEYIGECVLSEKACLHLMYRYGSIVSETEDEIFEKEKLNTLSSSERKRLKNQSLRYRTRINYLLQKIEESILKRKKITLKENEILSICGNFSIVRKRIIVKSNCIEEFPPLADSYFISRPGSDN